MKQGEKCAARAYRRQKEPCGRLADTIRRVQAAPGLWVRVPLCHLHQHVWDEGFAWGGPRIFYEEPCSVESKCETLKRMCDESEQTKSD